MARIVIVALAALTVLGGTACGIKTPPMDAGRKTPPNCVESSTTGTVICHVSMMALLGSPADYDGKLVVTYGYVHFEFEGDSVYLHKEDFDHRLVTNSLWISLSEGVKAEGCQDSYALIQGRFVAGFRGHMGLNPGEIAEVTRCDASSQ
jgi:hypothetical protein